MQIQVRTDDHIQGGESLAKWLQDETEAKLSRFKEYVTRAEIYITDVDGSSKNGAGDKRVTIEARPASRPPLAASAEADKVADAFTAAIEKLVRAIDSDLGRLKDKGGRDTIRSQEA